jgi:eukaryotic-like serine/threonine-protein kinase
MISDSAPLCLDEETLAAFVGGALDAERLPSVEAHLAGCSACRTVVADAAYGALELSTDRSARADETAAPRVDGGDRIADKYLVEQRLGSGGMGVVVAARHIELGQPVAIKLLYRRGEAAAARFLREARICARLTSDHIPRVFDIGRLDNGAPYIVMERLVGEDLGRLVARGPVPVADAVRYLLDACAALAEAHAAGIVHRDLKPANLFLTARPDGRPLIKVLDFGISKNTGADDDGGADVGLTSTGTMLGSPLYMSPEQIRARKDVDARTDIWSLGVILYELVTGRQPFRAPTLAAAAVTIAVDAPTPPSQLRPELPRGLDAIVSCCLEKEPGARYPSVEVLAAALRPFATGAMAPPSDAPSDRGAASRRMRRLRLSLSLALGVTAAIAGTNALLSKKAAEVGPPPDSASATLPPRLLAPVPPAPRAASPGPSEWRTSGHAPQDAPAPTKRRRPVRPGPLDTPD